MYYATYLFAETFAEIHMNSSQETLELFRERCLQLITIGDKLPVIRPQKLHELVRSSVIFSPLVFSLPGLSFHQLKAAFLL